MDSSSGNSNPQEVSPFQALQEMRRQEEKANNPQKGNNPTDQNSQKQPEQKKQQPVNNQGDKGKGNTKKNGVDIIDKFQYILYVTSLLIIPSMILPLPWVWSEFGKGITLLIFATLIVTLEIMKVFIDGKFSVAKGFLDLSILLILLSFLISAVFSRDRGMSLYGFEHRLGVSVLILTALILYFYILRSFMKTRKGLSWVLFFTVLGISISAFLSLLSFFGVNLFGFISSAKNLFIVGLPLTSSAVVGIIFWGAGLLLGALYILFVKGKTGVQTGVIFALSFFNIIAINMFSLNQGLYAALLVVLALLAMMIVMFLSREVFDNTKLILVTVLTVVMAVTFVVFKIPSVGDKISESTNAITQVALPGDVTWSIVTRTLSESVKTGVVGLGVDTFSVYYNAYKPAAIGDLDITGTNFVYGYNEVLTLTGNRGLIGALIWLGVGVMILYQLFRDFSGKGTRSREEAAYLQLADLALLFLFASSFVTYFTFELYFIFFMTFAVRVLMGSVLNPKDAEAFVVKLDILVEKVTQSKNNYLLLGLAGITAVVGLLLLSLSATSMTAGLKAMTIENDIIQTQIDIVEADANRETGEPSNYSFEDRENALTGLIDRYAEVINLMPDNSVYHRRRTILLNEYIVLLSEKLSSDAEALQEEGMSAEELQNEEEIVAQQNGLNGVIEVAVEEAEQTTEVGPNIFANWDMRSSLYSALVGLGLTTYTDSGLEATDRAVRFNPVCYTCYYRAAELFVVADDIEGAANAVSAALNINPNHIPSLILGAEIAIASEDYETALALLQRTIEILEAIEAEEDPLYDSILARMEEVEAIIDGGGQLDPLNPEDLPDEDAIDEEALEEALDDADLPDGPIDEILPGEEETPAEEEVPADEEPVDLPGDGLAP